MRNCLTCRVSLPIEKLLYCERYLMDDRVFSYKKNKEHKLLFLQLISMWSKIASLKFRAYNRMS